MTGLPTSKALVGPPVTNHQVIPYAKPGCKTCRGAGYFDVKYSTAAKPDGVLCGCACKRFFKANEHLIIRTNEGVFWKPEEAAPDPYATLAGTSSGVE